MKITTLVVGLVLGASCLGVGSCKTVAATQTRAPAPDCGRAEKAMIALEHGDMKAINDVARLMSCYDGAYADRVNVALGVLVTSYPEQIFAAIHEYRFNKAMINGVVNTQPWDLVDKPCKFVVELNRRFKAIDNVKGYTRETSIAKSSLKTFIPVVSESCLEDSKDDPDK